MTALKRTLFLAATLFLFAFAHAQVNLTTGLVAYYPFNGTALDASGNNNNGTFSGSATIVTDQWSNPNSAMNISGPNNAGRMTVANSASLQFSSTASFSFWFRLNSNVGTSGTGNIVAGGSHCLFAKDGDAGGGLYCLTALNGSNLNFSIGNVSMTTLSYTLASYTVGTWVHCVYIMDATEQRFYLNGSLVATVNGAPNFGTMNGRQFCLGRFGSNWYPMNAAEDEFRIYNRVLNLQEIAVLSNTAAVTATVDVINPATVCAGSAISVDITATGTVVAGNVYSIEISDATGGFTTPIKIGLLASSNLTATIPCAIPDGMPSGTGYKLRAVLSVPTYYGPASTNTLTVNGILGDLPSAASFRYIGNVSGRNYFLSNAAQIWTAAQTTCLSNSGVLATIPDAATNNLILPYNTAGVFIGYTDQVTEGTWLWADGSPTTYTNWAAGEPNNSGNQDYAQQYSAVGTWDDIGAAASLKYILQVRAAYSNTPVCSGSAITFFGATLAGATYSWAGPNGFTSTQQSPVIANTTLANGGTYTLTITKNGCTATATTTVVVNQAPAAMSATSPLLASLATGLALYYPMNGNANDASGNNLNGTSFNMTNVADRFGNPASALQGNGTNAYIDVPDGMYCTGDFTVSCWVKTGTYTSWGRIMDFGNGQANNNVVLSFSYQTSGRPSSEVYNGTVTGGQCVSPSVTTGTNQWALITYTFSNGSASIYKNGVLLATAPQTQPQNVLRTLCYIGRSAWPGDPYPNAAFDDFRLYNRVLSDMEIRSLVMQQPDAMNLVAIPAAICPNTASAIKVIGTQIGVSYQLQNAATSANIGAAQNGTGDTLSFATGNLAATTNFQVVATGPGGCSVIISPVTVSVITLANSPTTTGASRCEPGSVTLSAAGAPVGAVYYWYTQSTGGTQIYIGPNFTTPSLNSTTTYYVAIYANGCESNRTPVTATINLATAPAVDLYSGLIAHYKFDGNTADSSGRNNHAALNWNGAYVNDRFGNPNKAVQPVPNAYVNCGNAGDFQALNYNVTLSIWINEQNPNWGFQSPLMNKWQGNGMYMGLDNYYDIGQQQQMNRVRWRVDANTYVNSNVNVPYYTWTHIVCTYDGAHLRIYQNGVQTGVINYNGVITNTIVNFEIGRQANGGGNTIFEGMYDDARVYKRALNPDEVMALYFNGSVAFSNTPLCVGSTLQLSSPTIAGATYNWTGPNGFSSSQEDPAAITNVTAANAGTYSLVITNPNGCVSSPQLNTVVVNPLPAAPATVNDTVCASGNAILTASGGTTYAWYNSPTGGSPINGQTGATYTINNLTATDTFYVSIVSAAGCESSTRTMVIAQYLNPIQTNLAVSGSTVCASSSTATITVQNSQPGVSYQAFLSSTAVSNVVVGNGGTITLTVNTALLGTGSNTLTIHATQASCGTTNLTATATVVKNALPSATVTSSGPVNFCTGGSVTLSAPAGLNYLWSGGATTQSIVVTNTGSFSVTVTDANGCSNSSSTINVNVVAPPVATVSAAGPTTFCQGDNVTLNATGGGTYQWSNGGSGSSLTAGQSGNYYVVVSNGSCTDTSATITVTVNPAPSVSISASGPTTFCTGGSVTLTSTAANSYLWSEGSIGNAITVTQSGTYYVTVTNGIGCSATSSSITVNVMSPPNASITANGPLSFCQGGDVWLSANGGSSYTWSTGATSSSIFPSQAGTYYVIASNGSCTDTSAAVTVTVNPLPNVNFSMGNDTFFCIMGPVYTLPQGAPAGGTYTGAGVNGNQFNPMMAGLGYDVITYDYTDANGCSNSVSAVVYVDICTGITTNAAGTLTAMPNPTGGSTTITWPSTSAMQTLEVFDATGRVVLTKNVNGLASTEISLAGIAAGVYQVKLSGSEVMFLRLVKN